MTLSKFEKKMKRDGARNPSAVATFVGKKKYGVKKFNQKAQAGRKATGYKRGPNKKK